MNRKLPKIIGSVAVAALTATMFLTACDGNGEQPPKEVTGMSLTYAPGNYYILGETVREPNNSIEITYSDKSTETVSTADPSVKITGDTSTTGKHTGNISYGDFNYSFDYTVYEALDSTVETENGAVRGYSDGSGIEIYKGIPFAAPPVGNLRWRAPQDAEDWEDTLECYHFGPSPIQNVRSNDAYLVDPWSGTSEDCLTLNVWTSGSETEDAAEGKPVLVYIYGGGYTAGGGSVPIYDGAAMAQKDVVFVSFNYRLGKFGFLATEELKEENDGCGNFAILDQIKALQWVQDNITEFGGNPDNVTIMGQSAGAMSVEALLASPLADGLYHNAAILSAGMYFTKDLATMDKAIESSDIGDYTIEQLRAMTADEASKAVKRYNGNVVYDNYVITAPSTKDAFAKTTAYSKDVNIMVGCVTGDAGLYGDMRSITPGTSAESIVCQRNMLVNAHIAAGGTGKNWQYYYSYIQGGALVAGHTDDVTFWLGNTTNKYSWSNADTQMSNTLSAYLVNFCKTGDPNGDGLAEWTESHGDYNFLHIDNEGIEQEQITDDVIAAFEAAYGELSKFFPTK